MSIYHHFQPLWYLEQFNIFGYEALLRHDQFQNPEEYFQKARELDRLYELDTLSISNAIEVFSHFEHKYLFLNVYPSTVLNNCFPIFIDKILNLYPMINGRIVFELNESLLEEDYWNEPTFKERINLLRNQKFLIALDDVGKGGASLQKIIEFKPDYIKLDRFFSFELSLNPEKQRMIEYISGYCNDFQIQLILEGIEKASDLAFAKSLNVQMAQGYLLAKPHPIELILSN
jgi:EAL domain-containing protein (putative c-di-GMP-specific phosphodiesterase class I)